MLASARGRASVALLPAERVITRDDLKANTCTSALINASNPDATPADLATYNTIDADEAARIGDAVLAAHYQSHRETQAITSEPFLMSAPLRNTERLVWGQLWLPADDAGGYDQSKASIVYVDAFAAAPLFLYTDITVKNPLTGAGCVIPPPLPDPAVQAQRFTPLMLGVSLMMIAAGMVLDYRQRIRRLTLQK